MRYLELLNERISLAVDYKPIYDHLVYIIENIPELENIDEIDYDPKSFHQLMAYVVEHLFAFLNQYIRKYISISTQCIWDIGEIIHLPTLGAYYPDKDAIVINIEPLLFYFDAYLNKSSTH